MFYFDVILARRDGRRLRSIHCFPFVQVLTTLFSLLRWEMKVSVSFGNEGNIHRIYKHSAKIEKKNEKVFNLPGEFSCE